MQDGSYVDSIYGVRSPRLIYGTAWKKDLTAALVATALEQGFRGVDTACQPKHYDEAGVGAGVAAFLNTGGRRADLYLQTKYTPLGGQDPQRIPYDPAGQPAEQVAQSLAASLRNLRTTYLDCLVLHSPIADKKQSEQVWQAMELIVDAGGAKQIGISNCYSLSYLEALFAASRIKPAVVQNRFYAETGYDETIRAFCRQHGVVYQSFWTLTANPHLLAHRTMMSLAALHGRTPAQILFRYLTQEDVTPLTGTKSAAHMREDLDIFDFALTQSERASIAALL
jgi:diketogulonate reductase-like aldo/keto reductase